MPNNNEPLKLIRGNAALKVKPKDFVTPKSMLYEYNLQIGLDKKYGLPSLSNNSINITAPKNIIFNSEKKVQYIWNEIPELGKHKIKLFVEGSENSRIGNYDYFYKENANDSININLYGLNVKFYYLKAKRNYTQKRT